MKGSSLGGLRGWNEKMDGVSGRVEEGRHGVVCMTHCVGWVVGSIIFKRCLLDGSVRSSQCSVRSAATLLVVDSFAA